MNEKIGFVGVGRMGANMARRLKEIGYAVVAVYDANAVAAEALTRELACEPCAELAEVTRRSDVIITVISDDRAMKAVINGGLLRRARGRLLINCATLTPSVHGWVEGKAERVGAQSIEACMASSITQAREGSLYLMCGGKAEAFERALVNMVMNCNTAALAEGLALGDAVGLDLTMLREVFAQTGANSRVLQTDGEDMQNREHSCFFSAAHAAKDSGIALKLARQEGLNLPLAGATFRQYTQMVQQGLGELDKSGIAELTFKGRGKAPEVGDDKGNG